MQRLSETLFRSLLDQMDTFLFDCDEKSFYTVKNKRIILVTNNSSHTQKSYFEKCRKMGFSIQSEENVVTTSTVCCDYLRNFLQYSGKVYVIGSPGLGEELVRFGYSHLGIGVWLVHAIHVKISITKGDFVKAVIVGIDVHLSYAKVLKATTYLANPECHFLATNDDARFPGLHPSIVFPGAGAMVAAVKTSAKREPIVMGKPNKPIFDYVKSRFNIDINKTIMIGDSVLKSPSRDQSARCGGEASEEEVPVPELIQENSELQTDIAFAKSTGLKSLLVLSGNTKLDDVGTNDIVPDYFTDSVADFCHFA
ncbi:unnamed protein product [Soboliphyme baturini]|uniref:4-nitrophenylphosphatase n=1 Tax=Soboliphyme baturini TaxID=241478 RepID=A0A183IBD7_9BILA|nr:unnamed protein product [Soboliphyme baturini]